MLDKEKLLEWLKTEEGRSEGACSSYEEIDDLETFQYENGKRHVFIGLRHDILSGKFDGEQQPDI